MRELVNLEQFEDGFKAMCWANYCLRIDNLREELIPDYDPNNLPDAIVEWDRKNFENYFNKRYTNLRPID